MTNWKSLGKDALVTGLLAVLALLALSFSGWISFREVVPHDLATEVDLLGSRTIIGYVEEGDVVNYRYLGERIEGLLVEGEAIERRTESSWSKVIGYENKGTPQERVIVEARVFPQQAFTKYGDAWYYVEYAQTTKDAMELHEKEHAARAFFYKTAHAASLTAYAGGGDGSIANFVIANCSAGTNWTDVRSASAASSLGVSSTSSFMSLQIRGNPGGGGKGDIAACNIGRLFMPFDTSSLPASASISAASLNVYVASKVNDDNDGTDYLTVLQTTQATHTTLVAEDYDQCGALNSPTEGIDSGERKDITSITTGAYLSFSLNSTGRSWVKKSGESSSCSGTNGITCLGIREGHDVTNSMIDSTADNENTVGIYASEQTGTSEDPYLSVTYTASNFAFWQFQDF